MCYLFGTTILDGVFNSLCSFITQLILVFSHVNLANNVSAVVRNSIQSLSYFLFSLYIFIRVRNNIIRKLGCMLKLSIHFYSFIKKYSE